MKEKRISIKASFLIFILAAGALFSFVFNPGAGDPEKDEAVYLLPTKGYHFEGDLDYDYRENPFKITYADPCEINDMIWDHGNQTM
jgi:hypothetical protein